MGWGVERVTYRVGCDVDALLFAVGDEFILAEKWVTLDLVNGWNNTSCFNDRFELGFIYECDVQRGKPYLILGDLHVLGNGLIRQQI